MWFRMEDDEDCTCNAEIIEECCCGKFENQEEE